MILSKGVKGCLVPGCDRGCKNLYEHYHPTAVINRPKPEVTIPESVPNRVTNRPKEAGKPVPNVPNRAEYQRVKAWKIANREKYNSTMKELMRKKRAK